MAISLQPVVARVRKKLLRTPSVMKAADSSEVLAEGSTHEYSRIIELPDEIDRIMEFEKPSARDEYLRYRDNGQMTASPTTAYYYRAATIEHGGVYANGSFETLGPATGLERVVTRGKREDLANQMIATSWVSEKYFGHWVTDGLALELLAQRSQSTPLGLQRAAWTHEAGYRSLVDMHLHHTAFARVEGLWLVDDQPMNQARINRMQEIRRRVRAGVTPTGEQRPVFLLRDGGVARRLTNQNHIADGLARRGFRIISPEKETVAGLAECLATAPLVISVEGSALCHAALCMPEGSTMLAIQPPRRVTCIQKNNAEWAGLRMAHTVAHDEVDGFSVSEDRLMRLCDLIAAS